jgi:hypothetical protein
MFWPGQNPLGQRLRWLGKTGPSDNRDPLTVIGVVGNTRHDSLMVEEVPEICSQSTKARRGRVMPISSFAGRRPADSPR